MLPAIAGRISAADLDTLDLHFVASVLAQLGGVVLVTAAMAFLLLRRPPKARAKGLLPRLSAFAGTFLGVAFVWLPQQSLGTALSFLSLALMVSGAKRNPAFPDVPCAAEVGLPDYTVTTWYGLFAASATPRAVISKLHADVARALKTPEVIERLKRDGSDVVANEPAVFDAHVRTEIENARRIVKASGMRLD